MTSTTSALAIEFRDAMSRMCSPVSVITTMNGDRPHGTTVSAVMSLSMDPILVAVALAESSDCLRMIEQHGLFGVNVLGSTQQHTATRFATKGDDKLANVRWHASGGSPRLDGCAIWLSCETTDTFPAGDHRMLVGAVTDIGIDSDAAPLTYYRRGFGTHLAHS
ncbi:flavin reductase family protein [Gordonia sp. (in: high G+C Gram-positive bacteria)]|uniref:flavin reductase family protein n=1 Tax=Gordonia sp. (in: high G+C Gram-positive bacteria) TaxID=84139 RepID=UPI003F9B842D